MRSAQALVLFIVLASGACMPRHRELVVDPRARLAVGAETNAYDGPFREVFGGPRGETQAPREVTIAFSRPLRPP